MTKSPFVRQLQRVAKPLELIHTDVCGLLKVRSRGGYNYFITFTDDYTHFGRVFLMKHKFEAFEMFKIYKNEVEKKLKLSIKTLRSNRGGEYLSDEFLGYLEENEILSQWTPLATPQLNGVAEHRNHFLLDMV